MSSRAECSEKYPDDPSILDEIDLLRQIPRWHFFEDRETGQVRPSSAAFEDDSDGHPMSVYRSDLIAATGGNLDRILAAHTGFAVSAIAAGLVRSLDQTVHPEPLPDEAAHAVVCGNKTDSIRRKWARQARWVIPPPA